MQAALGRKACAEQSVVQEPLDACPEAHVAQMHEAMAAISCRHRRGDGHDYARRVQVLEVARTGMPCGTTAAFASTGYVATQRHRRGRPLGRGLATRDDAIVVERLGSGTTPLTAALQPLGLVAEQTLALDEDQRRRTLWRIDAGGGRVEEGHWLRGRGDHVHGKDDAGTRAQTRAARVTPWGHDPRIPERQVGWGPMAVTP